MSPSYNDTVLSLRIQPERDGLYNGSLSFWGVDVQIEAKALALRESETTAAFPCLFLELL